MPLDPHLEAYIAEALQAEDDVALADWLLDPQQDLLLLYGEEETPFSPGEGTSFFTGMVGHVASELQAGERLELPLFPGECTSSVSREILQVARGAADGATIFGWQRR